MARLSFFRKTQLHITGLNVCQTTETNTWMKQLIRLDAEMKYYSCCSDILINLSILILKNLNHGLGSLLRANTPMFTS